jgi:hypothetical protein
MGLRILFRYMLIRFLSSSRGQDIMPFLGKPVENFDNLLGCFSWTVYDFGHAAPELAMMVQVSVIDGFEGQVAEGM